MTRPHEDLERHTSTDHHSGGPPVGFAPGAWCAIEVAHVKAARVGAGISTYETLIEQGRASSAKVRAAAVLRSVDNRRVITLLEIAGHDAFRHLTSAWDDHHLNAERHAVAESRILGLYRVAASAGDGSFDPSSHDAYALEHVGCAPERARGLIAAIAPAPGFRGVVVFGADDASTSAVVYRFDHAEEITAFRGSAAAQQVIGAVGDGGESMSAVHPVRTFG